MIEHCYKRIAMTAEIHKKPENKYTYDRLNMLWERHEKYHEMNTFSTLEVLLEEHESYQKDFDDELKEEYVSQNYDRFLVQLSLNDLPYRYETMKLIEKYGTAGKNPYVKAFLDQFSHLDTDHDACFIFPESFSSQFFVILDVCRNAKEFHPVRNLFEDDEKTHYLAVFDKKNMDDVLLMYHLLYTNSSEDLYGGYSLYEYSLAWYQNHLMMDGIVLRSPYLPDATAVYQGALPYYFNPAKTVYVRRNIEHILNSGYFISELEFFLCLIQEIMPVFEWWYQDLTLYEQKDGYHTDWKLRRTEIRTRLTEEGIIRPRWKHELTLFHTIKKKYPDTLYQYRPEWLGLQSLDLYIPSIRTAIEYQGIQHYRPVEFFGGEEALTKRNDLDRRKKQLCIENDVRLIEWSYALDPTERNIREILENEEDDQLTEFLKLKSFDEYMEKFDHFLDLETGADTFEKETFLMENDDLYSHREKELLREKKKKDLIRGLHEKIDLLKREIETEGIWKPVKGRGKIEIRYQYPDGRRGDILHYLAGMYDEPLSVRNNEYVIKVKRKDTEVIEQMVLSNRLLFTQFRKLRDDPAVLFLTEFNRIAEIESLMYQANCIKEEYRSLRSVPDIELRKILNEYHKKLNHKADEIYEYLIAEGMSHPRWKSEQTAYAIVKAHYPDAKFQYQPDFLFGQRIDIFIPSKNTAIEYQGKQHYEPVDFFGGKDGQKANARRDMRKLRRCKAHGIAMIYWDYDRPLSDDYFVNEIMPLIEPKTE